MKKQRKRFPRRRPQKGRLLSVTIPRDLYDKLLNGRRKTEEAPLYPGLKTPEAVCEYLQSYMGLLGTVVEVIPE